MKIKDISGKILLSMYYLQLDNPLKLHSMVMDCFDEENKTNFNANDKNFNNILQKITNNESLLYNAFLYLIDKNMITVRRTRESMAGFAWTNLRLLDIGIDVIEGVEQNKEGRVKIGSLFNFNINNTVTVDSLIKSEIGNIVGIGAAASGKIDLSK